MKTQICILITTIVLVFFTAAEAQQVIATSGTTYAGNDISISWTLGQTVSETLGNSEIILTQGFQQPYNFYLTQTLNIPAGWSGISSYLDPLEKDIEGMFDPDIPGFVFLASMSGFYYPGEGVNTLGNWDSFTGYKIKTTNDTSLLIKGTKISQPEIMLDDGWSLIPVLNACGVTTEDFSEDLDSLVMIKEVGGAKVFWPAYGIETLLWLEPGKAYFVKMNESESYTFPECDKSAFLPQTQSIPEDFSPWEIPQHTAISHVIAFPSATISKSGIQKGDVVGVFTPGGVCAGIQKIVDLSSDIALVAFADDQFTAEAEGFTTGEFFHFRNFRPSGQQEMEMQVYFDGELPGKGLFQPQGLSAAGSIHIPASATAENALLKFEVYPNPSQGLFTLSVSHMPDQCKMLVLDVRGRIVRNITFDYIAAGSAVPINLQDLPKGIYILKLQCNNLIENKKIIIQ